jgi:Glycosyl transferase family 90
MMLERLVPASLMRRVGHKLVSSFARKPAVERVSQVAVETREQEVLQELRAPCAGCEDVRFTARLHAGRGDLVVVNFAETGEIEYSVASRFDSAERRDFYAMRWLRTRPLFAAVKRLYPGLVGRGNLWLDDLPRGSGLSLCGYTPAHVLVPDAVFLESSGYRELGLEVATRWIPWRERRAQVFWRGSSTGVPPRPDGDWRDIPRFKLCLKVQGSDNPHLFDIAVSRIVQVSDPRTVDEITSAGVLQDVVPLIKFMDYRSAIDIDGNSSSWPGLFTKLMMGNTVIKVDSMHGYRQWYYDRLMPWKNFIPLSAAMSELEELAMWIEAHPDQAEAIAMNGRELAKSMAFDRVMADIAPQIRDYFVAFGQAHEC